MYIHTCHIICIHIYVYLYIYICMYMYVVERCRSLEMLKSALFSFFKESQKMQKLLFWDFGNLDGKLTLKKKSRVLKFELHAVPKL